jgi:hypothetical protein
MQRSPRGAHAGAFPAARVRRLEERTVRARHLHRLAVDVHREDVRAVGGGAARRQRPQRPLPVAPAPQHRRLVGGAQRDVGHLRRGRGRSTGARWSAYPRRGRARSREVGVAPRAPRAAPPGPPRPPAAAARTRRRRAPRRRWRGCGRAPPRGAPPRPRPPRRRRASGGAASRSWADAGEVRARLRARCARGSREVRVGRGRGDKQRTSPRARRRGPRPRPRPPAARGGPAG